MSKDQMVQAVRLANIPQDVMAHSANDYVSAKSIEELTDNPYIPISPTTCEPLRERSPEERAEGRARVAAKAKAEAAAMEVQRKWMAARQSIGDKYYDEQDALYRQKVASNDNSARRVAA
jgi:hypothetical protein